MNIDDFASCLSRIKLANGKVTSNIEFQFLCLFILDHFEKRKSGGSVQLSQDEVPTLLGVRVRVTQFSFFQFFKVTLDL